jgi:RHS repeat-associated protein
MKTGGARVILLLMGALLAPGMATAAEKIYYFHNDHLGTPQAISDQSGRIVWKTEHDPFGTAVADEDPDQDGIAVNCNLRFPGQYYDVETGLHYNYHRDYDPGMGRYLEADPAGIKRGKDRLYVYASDNPTQYTDPLGLAYFALRSLGGLPWLGLLSCNALDDSTETEISHEQLFFEDGEWPMNLGFFNDSNLRADPEAQGYRCRSSKYNDCIMRKAYPRASVGKYSLIDNNCQHWAGRVRSEYELLARDPVVRKECGCEK